MFSGLVTILMVARPSKVTIFTGTKLPFRSRMDALPEICPSAYAPARVAVVVTLDCEVAEFADPVAAAVPPGAAVFPGNPPPLEAPVDEPVELAVDDVTSKAWKLFGEGASN